MSRRGLYKLTGISAAILFAVVCALPYPTFARNLGTIGPIYPIKEPDMLDELTQRATKLKESGELDKLQNKLVDDTREQVLRPTPVAGITRTQERRTFFHDPTMELQQDIVDANGTVIYPKGTRINPLEHKSLTRNVLLFDGDDREQVAWVKRVSSHYEGRVKLILTNGPVADMMHELNSPVFFDQKGLFTSRLGIEHVPAIVSQEGLVLRIDEVRPNDI